MNQILKGQAAKQKLLEGVNLAADIVGISLGVRGRNVGIDRGPDSIIVHDGVTIFKHITHEDPFVNFGIGVLRQAANKQVDQVGDGTTLVTVLGRAIITEAEKIVAAGHNPMALRKGLETAAEHLTHELRSLANPIKTREQMIQVATISAGDDELGEMIGDALHTIGKDGIITVEESKGVETYMEHQEGMQFDKGWVSQFFVNNPDRMEATIEDAHILLTDKTIVNLTELIPIMEKMIKNNWLNLVIIAEDITDSALGVAIGTKLKGQMNILCVRAPQFNEYQKDWLEDIAIMTNGRVISAEAQDRVENATLEDLGHARRVTAKKDATLIVSGDDDETKKEIESRVQGIRSLIERNEGSAFQLEKLRERIAKLSTGVSIIKVGGHTEIEMNERKERAIDAVAATQAAMEQGVVAGGEVAYLHARKVLVEDTKWIPNDKQEKDKINIHKVQQMPDPAFKIMYDALEQPFNKLVENAGMNAGQAQAFLSLEKEPNMGYDVTDGLIKDMVKAGIIDPVKVCISAINNAVSVAVQLITTEALIVPKPEEKK